MNRCKFCKGRLCHKFTINVDICAFVSVLNNPSIQMNVSNPESNIWSIAHSRCKYFESVKDPYYIIVLDLKSFKAIISGTSCSYDNIYGFRVGGHSVEIKLLYDQIVNIKFKTEQYALDYINEHNLINVKVKYIEDESSD